VSIVVRHLAELTTDQPAGQWDIAVVIDVIRAFSTAPWILRKGASRLLLAPDAEAAVAAQRAEFPDAILVKDGPPDPRFALPNSPGRIAQEDLTDRVVILATGNGTRGVYAVAGAGEVLCASFVNAAATARAASRHDKVLLVPTEGDEDQALAEYLTHAISAQGAPPAAPFLERVRSSDAGVECRARGLDSSFPGVHPDDLGRCLELDAFVDAISVRPAGTLLEASRPELRPSGGAR
jgi:2-phosphosulfolactate phosphatase